MKFTNKNIEESFNFYNSFVGTQVLNVYLLLKYFDWANGLNFKFVTYSSGKGCHGKHLQVFQSKQKLCSILFQTKSNGGRVKVRFTDGNAIVIDGERSIDNVAKIISASTTQ